MFRLTFLEIQNRIKRVWLMISSINLYCFDNIPPLNRFRIHPLVWYTCSILPVLILWFISPPPRVSAKRRTIVFSTVRPSVTSTNNWATFCIKKNSSCLYVQWNYKTNEPCPSVLLSVCRHLGALRCTDECSLIPRWILFSFGTWKEHILELCLGVLFWKNLENSNFGDFAH